MHRGSAALVIGLSLLVPASAQAVAPPCRHDAVAFARQAHQILVGSSRKRVRRLLGAPDDDDGEVWSYRNPPDRPDGPYQTFRFTFVAGKVSKIEEGSVSCVYRESSD